MTGCLDSLCSQEQSLYPYRQRRTTYEKVQSVLGSHHAAEPGLCSGIICPGPRAPWNLIRGNTFIGANVENPQGQNLGEIKDVVIDRASGRMAYSVVSFGGFLGMGEKLFAVPWGAFPHPRRTRIPSC